MKSALTLISKLMPCLMVLPLALIVTSTVSFLPPRMTIVLSQILARTFDRIPRRQEKAHFFYRYWKGALDRIKKYLCIRTSCLAEAIILKTMLNLSGISSEIKLGIDPLYTPLLAHAWLEIAEVPETRIGAEKYRQFGENPFNFRCD